MKKLLSALIMATCIFGLTACSGEKDGITYQQEAVESISTGVLDYVLNNSAEEALESLNTMDEFEWEQIEGMWRQQGLKLTGDVFLSAVTSWNASLPNIGEIPENVLEEIQIDVSSDDKNIYSVVTIPGSEHDAEAEIVFNDRLAVQSVTISIDYSFGELMGTAALNTVLGMGTVFLVLILISLIISCFRFIPKIQAAFTKKKDTAAAKEDAVDHTIAQIVEKEELTDDTELIAVIAAAVAAYEGAAGTDGFVVRSIKRANRRIR